MHNRYIDLSIFHEFNMKVKHEITNTTPLLDKHFWEKIITHTHASTC